MINQEKGLYEFGPFRLDPGKRVLLRDNQPVPLQLKAFETLLVLVRNSEQVVLRDDLMSAVWPDSFVEESNLTQNIFVLRKTLGETAEGDRYIVTIPGRGYRFARKVRLISDEDGLVVESHSRTRVVLEEQSFRDVGNTTIARQTTAPRIRWRVVVGTTVLGLAMAAVMFRPTVPPLRVTRIRQLTHIGTLVHNTRLVTDGPRIYFRMWEGKERVIRYVSQEGGEVFPVEKPFPDLEIDDVSPNGSEFLVANRGDSRNLVDPTAPPFGIWRVPVPSGSPRPVGDVHARAATWSPDGHTIAYVVDSDLYVVDPDGRNAWKLASLPGEPFYPVWSPDSKRLRFSVTDPGTNGTRLWEADLSTKTVRPLLPEWPSSERVWAGGWTPDGKYFFFTSLDDWTARNIWAIRREESLRRVNSEPVQITAGPLIFYLPTPSKDGKSVFVVGDQMRGQLLRYDAPTGEFVSYAQGISADHLAFSRNGQWMAYVEFPEGILFRSRVDGSERQQLTFPPMRAFSPQWSPDGTQIAFQGLAQMGAHNKIYLVPSRGGLPSLAAPAERDRQTYPSWTSDGGSILFSSSDETDSNPVLSILDLETKRVSILPGTAGLYLAQISPDGRHVAAIEEATRRLMLYDMVSHQTRTLATLGDYPRWSADGQYVYFSTPYWNGGSNGGVYRWNVATHATEIVTPYPEFLLTGAWGVCYGLTPDGETLMLRDVSTRDLYALDMELP